MPKVRSGERLKAYRQSYNYRSEYFKRNPGLFGHIWFCSQCFKPLIGRKNVVIDHIIPLSKGGRNHVSNCTAICQKCNRDKSDKIDGRVARGTVFKLFESTMFRGQRGVGAAAGLTVGLTAGAVNSAAHAGGGIIKRGLRLGGKVLVGSAKLVTLPIRRGNTVSRLVAVAAYVGVAMYLLSKYTSLLDTWIK